MVNIQYSVLCHYPSIVSKDCITLGILFYNRSEKKCVFETTKKWDRVKSFNDELDIELLKLQLNGIGEEVCEFAKSNKFNLSEYIKFYVNELKFTEIVDVEVDNFQEFVNECKRQYFLFDFSKKDRPSMDEQINFVKNIMKKSDISYKINPIKGIFGENIKFDFTIDEYAFKLFRFEGKQENRLIRSIKEWAYDAYKLKNHYNFIFVTDIDFNKSEDYKILYKILNEECKDIINFGELVPFIQKISNRSLINF